MNSMIVFYLDILLLVAKLEKGFCRVFPTCGIFQKAKKATGKKFGMMIQMKQQKFPWEIAHIDWVTALPPGGDRSFNACLVLIDRYIKIQMFLPCHKDDTAMDAAIMICNRVLSHTHHRKRLGTCIQ
ncbi:hypothetical protein O181_082636, partial [Austropuccinia psidii MF-1]|nr:hypothetical protein [Austropuccinia psidii MF-1]